jgi:hypothetical protein
VVVAVVGHGIAVAVLVEALVHAAAERAGEALRAVHAVARVDRGAAPVTALRPGRAADGRAALGGVVVVPAVGSPGRRSDPRLAPDEEQEEREDRASRPGQRSECSALRRLHDEPAVDEGRLVTGR